MEEDRFGIYAWLGLAGGATHRYCLQHYSPTEYTRTKFERDLSRKKASNTGFVSWINWRVRHRNYLRALTWRYQNEVILVPSRFDFNRFLQNFHQFLHIWQGISRKITIMVTVEDLYKYWELFDADKDKVSEVRSLKMMGTRFYLRGIYIGLQMSCCVN